MKIHTLSLIATLSILPFLSAPAAGPAPMSCCSNADTSGCMSTAKFADTVATVDMLEIKLGEVAQTNASLPSVKKFGAHMVESHTQIQTALAKIAAEEKIALPTKLDSKHQAILKKLSALKGADFDKAYIPAMVEGHTKVLAMFQKFSESCSDPAFKKFATKTTPVIANHLKMAKKVQAQMQKDNLL